MMVKVTAKHEEEENPFGLDGPVVGLGLSMKWNFSCFLYSCSPWWVNSQLSSKILKADDAALKHESVFEGGVWM